MNKMNEEKTQNDAVNEEAVEEKEVVNEEVSDDSKASEEESANESSETKEDDELSKLKKELESLKAENEELQTKVNGLKNAYAKAYADTENIKKRLNNDFEMRNKYRAQDFAKEVLPVLDNCERALAIETTDGTDEKYRKAFEMVHKQLVKALEKEGVTEIDCLNKPFDPNYHQAMMSEHIDGVEPNTVTAVLQKGYILKDRLLRAAMVKVSE